MDNKYRLSYEETDKKLEVEIYGLQFEIKKISKETMNELKELMKDQTEDIKILYKYIDLFLGEGSANKLEEQRKKDKQPAMDMNVVTTILAFIIKTIANDIYKTQHEAIEQIQNRSQRRNYNREYNRGYNNRRYKGRR